MAGCRSESPAKAPDEELDYEEDLYKMQVEKRNEMRRQRGNVPSYTIFPNTVLKKLASRKPANADEAMAIKGIGPVKAETILPAFLEIIAEWDRIRKWRKKNNHRGHREAQRGAGAQLGMRN